MFLQLLRIGFINHNLKAFLWSKSSSLSERTWPKIGMQWHVLRGHIWTNHLIQGWSLEKAGRTGRFGGLYNLSFATDTGTPESLLSRIFILTASFLAVKTVLPHLLLRNAFFFVPFVSGAGRQIFRLFIRQSLRLLMTAQVMKRWLYDGSL